MGANRDSLARDLHNGRLTGPTTPGEVPPSSSFSLDGTLPPTPLRELLELEGAAIFMLSTDRELKETVARTAGERYPIRSIVEWEALVEAAAAQRARIVLLDADSLPMALPEAVDVLYRAAPTIVVLVAATRDSDAAGVAMELMAQRQVHRLLVKPATDAMTRLLLESAIDRYLELREQFIPPPISVAEFGSRHRQRKSRTVWSASRFAAALALVMVAGAAVVVQTRGLRWQDVLERLVPRDADVELASRLPQSPHETGLASEHASRPSERGTVPAVTEPLVTVPTFDKAAAESIASSAASESSSDLNPASAEIEGVSHVVDEARDSKPAVLASKPATDPASIGPENVLAPPRLETTTRESELGTTVAAEPRARASVDAERDAAPAAEPEPRAATDVEFDRLLDLVDVRLADGRLLTPYDDSAVRYFERAMARNPLDPRLLTRREAIAAGLVDAALVAVERGDLLEAERLADEAFRLGADRAALGRLDRELDAARREQTVARHAALLANARVLLQQGDLLDADGNGALATLARLRRERASVPGLDAAWREATEAVRARVSDAIDARDFAAARRWASALAIAGGDPELAADLEFEARQAEFLATPIAAGELELIEARPPVYPDGALAGGVEGWVDVEYVVDREGRPRDIVVLDSHPRHRFVDAAIEAIESHRYVPFQLDGRVYERRVRTRIRFDIK